VAIEREWADVTQHFKGSVREYKEVGGDSAESGEGKLQKLKEGL
jgi:hypothetical protein